MIKQKDYLRPICEMSAKERAQLTAMISSWRMHEASLRACETWTADDVKAFDDGLRLASTLVEARPFIAMAYRMSVARRVAKIGEYVNIVATHTGGKTKEEKQAIKQAAPPKITKQSACPPRPDHFDSWLEHMTPELRADVLTLHDLNTQKTFYRQELEKAVEGGKTSKMDISRLARLVVGYGRKIQNIYDRTDIEWNELNGFSVSTDVREQLRKKVKSTERDFDDAINGRKPRGRVAGKGTKKKEEAQDVTEEPTPAQEENEDDIVCGTPARYSPIPLENKAEYTMADLTEYQIDLMNVRQLRRVKDMPEEMLFSKTMRRYKDDRRFIGMMTKKNANEELVARIRERIVELNENKQRMSVRLRRLLSNAGINPDEL